VAGDGTLTVGTPGDTTIYETPFNTFTAGFMGSPAMDFAPCSASCNNGTLVLSSGTLRLEIGATADVPEAVTLGVRPGHGRLWSGERMLLLPLEGIVQFEEALGRETLLGVAVDDAVRLVVLAEGLERPRLGEKIRFGLVPGNLYLFEPSAERLLGRV
jgi:ABC-type sugar transport system ATPase subunit